MPPTHKHEHQIKIIFTKFHIPNSPLVQRVEGLGGQKRGLGRTWVYRRRPKMVRDKGYAYLSVRDLWASPRKI